MLVEGFRDLQGEFVLCAVLIGLVEVKRFKMIRVLVFVATSERFHLAMFWF